jgi:hypothetical protein
MKWLSCALVLGGIAIGGPAYAQGGQGGPGGWGGGPMRMLQQADANGDGVVTRDEYVAFTDQRFARMDKNGDGVITPDERPQWGGGHGRHGAESAPPSAAAPASGAAPSAGGETRDQFRAQAMRRFDMLDTNHDGKIDQAEMQAAAARMSAMRGGGGYGPAPAGAPQQ